MADQLLEIKDVIEKEVSIINNIIAQASIHNSFIDGMSSVKTNDESLYYSINEWLEFNELENEYTVAEILIDSIEAFVYQIIDKNNFNGIRHMMIQKWFNIYNDNDVCMCHLLSSDEANELTESEKNKLLMICGED